MNAHIPANVQARTDRHVFRGLRGEGGKPSEPTVVVVRRCQPARGQTGLIGVTQVNILENAFVGVVESLIINFTSTQDEIGILNRGTPSSLIPPPVPKLA